MCGHETTEQLLLCILHNIYISRVISKLDYTVAVKPSWKHVPVGEIFEEGDEDEEDDDFTPRPGDTVAVGRYSRCSSSVASNLSSITKFVPGGVLDLVTFSDASDETNPPAAIDGDGCTPKAEEHQKPRRKLTPMVSPKPLLMTKKGNYLFVCLSVTNITQRVMNGLQLNFMEGSRVVKGTWLDFGSDPDHIHECSRQFI